MAEIACQLHGVRRQSGSGDGAFRAIIAEHPPRSAPPKAVPLLSLCHRTPWHWADRHNPQAQKPAPPWRSIARFDFLRRFP
jgi:hypothetical protein